MTSMVKFVSLLAYEKLPLPLPSEPEDNPPLKKRLLITVAPVDGMVREAARENLSNVTEDKLAMLKDELVLPVSSNDVPVVVVVILASAVILTGQKRVHGKA